MLTIKCFTFINLRKTNSNYFLLLYTCSFILTKYYLFSRMCRERASCVWFKDTTHTDIWSQTHKRITVCFEFAKTDCRWQKSRSQRISAHGSHWFWQRRWTYSMAVWRYPTFSQDRPDSGSLHLDTGLVNSMLSLLIQVLTKVILIKVIMNSLCMWKLLLFDSYTEKIVIKTLL